jgi:hypothetical protein
MTRANPPNGPWRPTVSRIHTRIMAIFWWGMTAVWIRIEVRLILNAHSATDRLAHGALLALGLLGIVFSLAFGIALFTRPEILGKCRPRAAAGRTRP